MLAKEAVVAKVDRQAIQLDDDEHGRLHVCWSRSGKRLIVTATTDRWTAPMQVELQQDQVEVLIESLATTVASAPAER